MGENVLGLNQVFPIYNADGTPFFDLELKKSTFESSIMSLGDKITGYVYYKDNSLAVTMGEYIEYKNNPEDENERAVRYELVNPPTIVREGMVSDNSELKGMTKYAFEFYHPMYKLGNIPFTDIAVTDSEEKYLSQNKTFAWIGNLFEFIDKISANLNATEWSIDYDIQHYEQDGQTETSEWQKAMKQSDVLSFDKQFISDALKAAFDEWEIPFTITPYNGQGTVRFIITFGLPSQEIYSVDEHGDITQTPYVFRFGQGVGLKNNSRNPRNNKIVTRICGYGAERNIPYGYPQIVWHGNQSWDYTIDNDPTNPLSYPIYDGIVNGQKVRLIKHPFTRTTLMPAIYHETVRRKVDPLDSHYDPDTEIIDYRDAGVGYPNPINPLSPSVEIHQFEDIYPRLIDGQGESYEIEEFNIYDEKAIQYITWNNFVQYVNTLAQNAINEKEANILRNLPAEIEDTYSATYESIEGSYIVKYEYRKDDTFVYVKYVSDTAAFDKIVLQQGKTYEPTLVDEIDDDGNYIQSYFTVTLPILDFDLYACASITEKMDINMRSGACLGCTFPVQVDWEDYKKNFYDADGKFDPVIGDGHPRDGEKYPDSSQERITLILQKETETFGVIMPNIYQYPHSGDAFVILGISLPQSYIENAEVELEDAMLEYMLENNVHYFDYPLKFDEYFLAKNNKILAQIKNNSIVRFQYAGTEMALYVKQITIKFGESVLPQYDITLTDDVEIVLNQIGQVTDDVSRMRVQLSELQKYYSENLINAINDKLSRTVDDICNGRITFQQGIDVIGATLFHDSLQSPDFSSGMYDGRGWRIDNLGNAEFESIRVRSFLEVVELIVNRLQAQEGDTLFTDNDQIDFVQRVENQQHEVSYILSLKEKYDGYITAQKTGNIIKGIINTLAAKQAGVSQYDDSDAVETDGDNTYFTSWMRVVEDSNTSGSTLKTNQIRIVLYGDNDTPAGKNFVPCELMTIARWGCYLDPDEVGISSAEKQSRIRRQRMFSISVTDGRVTKYTKVNKPKIENTSFGVTIGELPEFVKNYSAVRSVLDVVGEHTDWLYAQGIVVGNFIKVDINGVPEVSYIDCGAWVNGGQIPSPSPRNGIYLCNEWNNETQQYETHDVWHNNAKWRCNQHQPVVSGGTTTYYEPTDNSQYWTKLEEGTQGDTVRTVTVFKSSDTRPSTPTGSAIPPDGWTLTPPTGQNLKIWASVATFVNNVISGTWSEPTRWNGDKGNDGTSPFIVDIDNEMDSIACDYAGEAAGGGRLYFKISAFYGESPVTSACKVRQVSNDTGFVAKLVSSEGSTETGTTITGTETAIGSNPYVRISFDDGDYVEKKSSLVLEISHSTYGTRQVSFTLNGVWAGEDGSPAVVYNILTDQTHINASRTDSGGYSPSTGSLKCGYTKNVGGTMTSVADSTTRIDLMYDIFYRKRTRSNKTWQTTYYRYRTYKAHPNDNYKVRGFSLETWDAVEIIICNAPNSTNLFSESQISNYDVIDRETVPVVSDGEKGDSAITADLSNEIDSVACTNDMKTLVATNLYSKVSLHKGTTDITSASQIKYVTKPSNASLYLESSGSGTSGSSLEDSYTAIGNNQYIRVYFSNNVELSSEQNVVLMVKNGSVELQLVFTILGVKGSSVYSLVPSVNVISKNTQDQYTPSVITCKSTKFDVLSGVTTENPSDATIKYTKDGVATEYSYSSGLTTGTDFTSYVVFLLYVGGNVVDKETVNIVSDGKDADQVRPNMLLRTVFEQGIDRIAEKWGWTSGAVSLNTASSTKYVQGRQTIRFSSSDANSNAGLTQSVLGKMKANTWYAFSFYAYANRSYKFYINNVVSGDRTAIYNGKPIVDGVEYTVTGNIGHNDINFSASDAAGYAYHTIVFQTNESLENATVLEVGFYMSRSTGEEYALIGCTKLEEGDSATAYMANEDDLKGSNGVRGKVGRFYYYAGEFDVNDNTHSFLVNDAQAPYFKTGGTTFHVYNSDTNGSFTMAQMGDDFNSAPWEIMTNDFKYIITEAIFGKYAHFGSFIINGDWMLSQHGTLVSSGGTEIIVDETNQDVQYGNGVTTTVLNGNSVDNGVIVCQVSFTVDTNTQVSITITPSSESSTDFGAVGELDSDELKDATAATIKNNTVTSLIKASGTTAVITTVNVSAGTHFFYIAYAKDGSLATGSDNATFSFGSLTYSADLVKKSDGMTYTSPKWGVAYTWFDSDDPLAKTLPSTGYKFRPNFAVDALTGASYQNRAYVAGNILTPYLRITNNNYSNYQYTNYMGEVCLWLDKSGFNVQIEASSITQIKLPRITSDMLGCEINIFNATAGTIDVFGSGGNTGQSSERYFCPLIKPSEASDLRTTNFNIGISKFMEAKFKAIDNGYEGNTQEITERYRYSWLCCYVNINP